MTIAERLRPMWHEFLATSGHAARYIVMSPALFAQYESEIVPCVRCFDGPVREPHDGHLVFKSSKVYPRDVCPPDSIYLMDYLPHG